MVHITLPIEQVSALHRAGRLLQDLNDYDDVVFPEDLDHSDLDKGLDILADVLKLEGRLHPNAD